MGTPDHPHRVAWLSRLFGVRPHEAPAVAAGLAMFFLLFTGYFMLRPVRETMGVAGGVDNLQWLFTGTFLATLAVLPLYGWIASKVPRRRIVPWVFGLVAASLLGFGAGLVLQPENVWASDGAYSAMGLLSAFIVVKDGDLRFAHTAERSGRSCLSERSACSPINRSSSPGRGSAGSRWAPSSRWARRRYSRVRSMPSSDDVCRAFIGV